MFCVISYLKHAPTQALPLTQTIKSISNMCEQFPYLILWILSRILM